MWRAHQKKMDEICTEVVRGAKIRRIVGQIAPGAGKSALPLILAHRLIPFLAQKICWVVPRLSLLSQAEEVFIDPTFKKMLGHQRLIRASTNEPDPTRGHCGYVTTYSALSQDKGNSNEREFSRHRYMLVLDENHHLSGDAAALKVVEKLIERAVLVLFMSGTMERSRHQPIAFLSYLADGKEQHLQLKDTGDTRVISYSRADALAEHAIIPLNFHFVDASAEWKSAGGVFSKVHSLKNAPKDMAKEALYVAISSQYAKDLLDHAMVDFLEKKKSNPRAKLLVVAARQKLAKEYARYIESKYYKKVAIATMEEGAAAQRGIQRFKLTAGAEKVDILSTVGMAYEGLDVKQITHLVSLTLIRSTPWLTQMLARATRFDPLSGPWASQEADCFLPDDEPMHKVCQLIEAEQRAFAKQKSFSRGMACAGHEPTDLFGDLIPVSSSALSKRKQAMSTGASELLPAPELTPSQREAMLRESIESEVRSFAHKRRQSFKAVNVKLVRRFGKSRTVMSAVELEKVESWVRRNMK